MKVLSIILGVLLIIGGVWCMASPGLTFLTLGWVIGIGMLVSAVGGICSYSDRKALGYADGWSLLGSILSLVLALILLCSNMFQFLTEILVAVVAGIWMLSMGAIRLAASFKMLSLRAQLPREMRGYHWLWTMILGILMIVAGVIGFIHPAVMAMTIGIIMGAYVLMAGVNIISMACFMPD